ncbi:MAG: DUF445 family protein [Planctomycetota bacterium]
MPISPSAWILLPLLGGLIGYGTNLLAVKMIFRPIRPRRFLGFTVQGLVGRRQAEIARSIGSVVGDHLLSHKDLVAALENADLHGLLDGLLEQRLPEVLAGIKKGLGPLGAMLDTFLSAERLADLRGKLVAKILEDRETLVAHMERALESGLKVPEIVERKVAEFPVERLEQLILQVASRELRSIEILGGVLGLLIGVLQTALLALL